MATNYYSDNKDIQFYVNEYLDWKSLIDLRETFYTNPDGDDEAPADFEEAFDTTKTILDYVGQIVGDVVFPNSSIIDHKGGAMYDASTKEVSFPPEVNQTMELLSEAGLMGISLPRKYSGMNCCEAAGIIANEILSLGDAGLTTTATLQWGVASIINHFADEEVKKEFIPKLASGEYGAAMVLTEAGAGSDLANLTTKAIHDPKTDKWLISGSKRFITNGQSEVHLVLARSEPDTAGDMRGISLFLVDGRDSGVEVTRIEEKLGIHGSATCELIYDNAPGILIGKRRFGLVKYMFALMNEARLGVATQGIGLAQAAYNEALRYADEREQFGEKICNFPAVAKMLVDMKMDIESARAIIYKTAWYVDMYMSIEKYLVTVKQELKEADGKKKEELKAKRDTLQADMKKYHAYADVLTPLSKMRSGRMCVEVTDKAIQVLGGAGYTQEYQCERLFRDARIVDIYEGTGQLQVKAAISGVLNKKLSPIMDEILSKAKEKNDKELKATIKLMDEAKVGLDEAIDYIRSQQDKPDYEVRLYLYEGRLCQMTHELFSGFQLLDQALISDRKKKVVKVFVAEMTTRLHMFKEQILNGDLEIVNSFDILTENNF